MLNNPWGGGTANTLARLAGQVGVSCTIEWDDAARSFVVDGKRMGESADSVMSWIHSHSDRKWTIRNKRTGWCDADPSLFWSNEAGWVSRSDATIFTAAERATLNLPIDGEWF